MICKKCKKEIEKYCEFPGGICLQCHEIEFNKKELNEMGLNEMTEMFKNGIIIN